jgi:hypothetical protein
MSVPLIVILYTAAFVAAQYWGLWFIKDALSIFGPSPISGPPTPRFVLISGIEAVVAGAALTLGLLVRRVVPRPPTVAWLSLAAVAGAVVSLVTVGPWTMVPRVTEGDAQLALCALVAAIASFALGYLTSTVRQGQVRHDG